LEKPPTRSSIIALRHVRDAARRSASAERGITPRAKCSIGPSPSL
jgi:hypothetical protein